MQPSGLRRLMCPCACLANYGLRTNLVNRFQQVTYGLVRIYAFRDALQSMPEDKPCHSTVDVCGIQHAGKRMAALMRRMLHVELFHDRAENVTTERIISVCPAVGAVYQILIRFMQQFLIPWQ